MLHTHPTLAPPPPPPAAASSSRSKGSSKTSHAAISKLFSVVEIVKREFDEYQRAAWRAEAAAARLEQTARELKIPLKVDKGKQRVTANAAAEPDGSTGPAPKPKRSLQRIFQYNELDYLERNATRAAAAQVETNRVAKAGPVNEKGNVPDEEQLDGLATLDKAIQDHVVAGRKR